MVPVANITKFAIRANVFSGGELDCELSKEDDSKDSRPDFERADLSLSLSHVIFNNGKLSIRHVPIVCEFVQVYVAFVRFI